MTNDGEQSGSLPDELRRCGVASERSTNKPAHLLCAIKQLVKSIDEERAAAPPKPGWRVVEMIRDILVDTIETHQNTR